MTSFFGDAPATTTQQSSGTSTANPWAPASPALQNIIQQYAGLNTGVTPQQQQAGQNLWGAASSIPNLGPQTTAALQQLFGNAGMLQSANQQIQGNLSPIAGANLNPWMTPGFGDAMTQLNNQIKTGVQGTYAASGRSPSGAGDFGKSLAIGETQADAPIIQSQYNQNVANRINANQGILGAATGTSGAMNSWLSSLLGGAGMIPGIYTAPGQAQVGAANTMQGQQVANLNPVAQALMGLGGMGGQTTTTQQQTGTQTPAQSGLSNTLGLISGLASLWPSDRRLKTDVKKIGETHDKQNIYSYRFKAGGAPQIGMMADEVEKKTPEAVATGPDGMKMVNYDAATRKAATMGMMRAY